jgi:putative flavoprotein involved in K+ transport
MPRRYRGMDIFWWLESTGRLARTIDDVPDATAARRETSLQLAGRNGPELFGQNLDLAVLQANGVRLAGHLQRVSGGRAWFRDDLEDTVRAADRRMRRFLNVVDDYVRRAGLGREVWEPVRPRPVELPTPVACLNLIAEPISTIVLATGYRPYYPWLHLPVTAPDGSIEQRHGVTAAPGVYVVGQRFQHRRDSGFIDGARHDAQAVVRHLLSRHADTVQAA